jgi:hypothetical protein
MKFGQVLGLDEVLIKSEDWMRFDKVLGLDEV